MQSGLHQYGKFVLCNRDLGCAVLTLPIYFKILGVQISSILVRGRKRGEKVVHNPPPINNNYNLK